ncbi:MAG: D-aminoacylase [Bacteroidota bacterium]|nr:D-aminoacylase [Bacteroidota bacterium]MDE2835683.1 D-aminoacylase [Bacteroidota bacterium]
MGIGRFCLPLLLGAVLGCQPADYDLIIRGGTVYDGTGGAPYLADIGINDDMIDSIGDLADARGGQELDVAGLAVAPGFINMLSWAPRSLILDGRSMSDIHQGVTLEIFGEGVSMGPLNSTMKDEMHQSMVRLAGSDSAAAALLGNRTLPWTTLNEYLTFLEQKGVSPNVASFVGATTVRMHELGSEERAPDAVELARMQALVREAMQDGALGVGSSLIYAPAFFADTRELIALARVAGEFGGMYISHLRSEGARLIESAEELIEIARQADVSAQIYHIKAAGRENWPKMEELIAVIESARDEGLRITADMYTYTAGATGLNASMPPFVQAGGFEAWRSNLQDPAIRARLEVEMMTPTDEWENLMLAAGPENVTVVGFRNEALRHYMGKSLAEIARERNASVPSVIMDLIVDDSSRVESVYHLMSEENLRLKLRQPWVSIDSDAASIAPEPPFTRSMPHPRAYGSFARLLSKYVRQEGVLTLEEGIRRMTGLPAANLNLDRRGLLWTGYFADLAIFDPDTIQDHATFEDPHQMATGMVHVLVNGELVLLAGEHTGAMPGRVIRSSRASK